MTKYCVLNVAAADNNDANSNNIIFTIKGTKLYVPFAALLAKDNQKLSNTFSKIFERSVYWNEYKQRVRIKIPQINIDTFSNQILLELINYLF